MAAAAGDGAAKPLQSAMKLANRAIELDTGNRPREAYMEYLRSIHYISQVLLEDVENTTEAGETVPPETSKMLKLAEQCLERAQSTATKLGKICLKPAVPVAPPIPLPTTRHRRVCSDEGGKLSPFLPPEIFQKLQVAEPQNSKKELSPLEKASLQNQKLRATYEARMARLDPSQAVQKTSLTLSLQRQMMENLVIAKAREETASLRRDECGLELGWRRGRLVFLLRRFCSQVALTPEEREQRALYAAILEYEQDHDWPKHWRTKLKRSPGDLSVVTSLVSHLLSLPDHPISQLLKKLQCAVYSALYPIVSRAAISAVPAPGCCSLPPEANGLLAPGSRRLRSSQSLYCMLSPSEPSAAPRPLDGPPSMPSIPTLHSGPLDREADSSPAGPSSPLIDASSHLPDKDSSFEDLEQFLAISEPQTPGSKREPLLECLKSTVKDIHNAIDRLLSLTLLAFEGLNTATSKDRCLACIEEPFFSPLWPLLLALYRSVHRTQEAAVSRSMELYRNAPPTALGIPAKLLPRVSESQASTYPYCTAAQELGLLVLESCPQKKLECIVRTLRVICICAEDYCRAQEARTEAGSQPPAAAISGADDLLPILSFVVLRSGLPQLVSECAALEEFIHEGYLIGEEGYCLTSLQSALSYVELLSRGRLDKKW
ncbi:Vacuolar sorting protein 9, subgroup containing protein [Cricetulus griseus]|uniref:Vacuolar sorting protein 9, subgroup containing protein n=1 Tax=Cricetulus griseus TaxID=10029 RepID=A0A061IEU7_CRIGR|nr:Vacuolar sorting protein 9, subgroup containing protein [Cricetulus griseus]